MKELKAPGTNTYLAWLCIEDTVVRGHLFSPDPVDNPQCHCCPTTPLTPPLGNR